jgi:hypothetical protein
MTGCDLWSTDTGTQTSEFTCIFHSKCFRRLRGTTVPSAREFSASPLYDATSGPTHRNAPSYVAFVIVGSDTDPPWLLMWSRNIAGRRATCVTCALSRLQIKRQWTDTGWYTLSATSTSSAPCAGPVSSSSKYPLLAWTLSQSSTWLHLKLTLPATCIIITPWI